MGDPDRKEIGVDGDLARHALRRRRHRHHQLCYRRLRRLVRVRVLESGRKGGGGTSGDIVVVSSIGKRMTAIALHLHPHH
jgi:hypothetical protein